MKSIGSDSDPIDLTLLISAAPNKSAELKRYISRGLIVMDNYIFFLAYIGYISISSVIAFPLLKAKSQLPSGGLTDMVLFNFLALGSLPFIAFLMKYPPENPSIAESYEYYEQGKIWKWNK